MFPFPYKVKTKNGEITILDYSFKDYKVEFLDERGNECYAYFDMDMKDWLYIEYNGERVYI